MQHFEEQERGEGEVVDRLVHLNRVAKVVKGGRRFSFSALVVAGDGNGIVGAGLGKAGEVPDAIRKGVEDAKKQLIRIPLRGSTLPHAVEHRFNAAKVMLKPAAPGTGIIAGEPVRYVMEAAGVRDVLTKEYGSTNRINVVRATMQALQELQDPEQKARERGISVNRMLYGREALGV